MFFSGSHICDFKKYFNLDNLNGRRRCEDMPQETDNPPKVALEMPKTLFEEACLTNWNKILMKCE